MHQTPGTWVMKGNIIDDSTIGNTLVSLVIHLCRSCFRMCWLEKYGAILPRRSSLVDAAFAVADTFQLRWVCSTQSILG